ncbi:MAG: sigma-54-dependent transcriptional regulator [Bacteroidota bacterium]
MTSYVLIIEDDDSLRKLLKEEVEDMRLPVQTAASVEEARRAIGQAKPDLIITDVRLPGTTGLDLLKSVAREPDGPAVIVITAFGTIRQAVEALRLGAEDFLTKPLDLDHLRISVERVLERLQLRRRVDLYQRALGPAGFHGIIGQSESVLRLVDEIQLIARASGPVLITGESGTGKELVARAVHAESQRSSGPFIPINCAGVPAELLESEFFGHEKGAFTGASGRHVGLFMQADGGTLLLDEIGEMPILLQAKLLRVLQEGRIRPVGGSEEKDVDVRVIASTNRDLEEEMKAGRFRDDLYFRLETFKLDVPPLREREDDVDLLALYFAQRHAAKNERPDPRLDPQVAELLRRYPFPGNVRELDNAMERAVVFSGDGLITPRHLPAKMRDFSASRPSKDRFRGEWLASDGGLRPLEVIETDYIQYVLEATGGNKRQAAKILGVSRRTLYRKLEETAPS